MCNIVGESHKNIGAAIGPYDLGKEHVSSSLIINKENVSTWVSLNSILFRFSMTGEKFRSQGKLSTVFFKI